MDYFNNNPAGRRRGNTLGQARSNGQQQSGRPLLSGGGSYENMRQPSSIRIRRLPSNNTMSRPNSGVMESPGFNVGQQDFASGDTPGRRRSSSAPQRPSGLAQQQDSELQRQRTVDGSHMPSIVEGQATAAQQARGVPSAANNPVDDLRAETLANGTQAPGANNESSEGAQAMQSAGNAARQTRGLRRFRSGALPPRQEYTADNEYDANVLSMLDLVDPEVQTLGTLTNMQNSLFVPDLGRLINRRPTYDLTKRAGTGLPADRQQGPIKVPRTRAGTRASEAPPSKDDDVEKPEGMPDADEGHEPEPQDPARRNSINSQMTESHFAVLPHGVTLEGWSDEDIEELNDYVRHLLHSRREGFKRSMRGFGKYVSKPLGAFVTFYAVSVTLFGLAWVLALIGWISAGSRQSYIINVIDLVLVALFALMGDGLAPFRVIDTYHMCFIAHYHHYTWRVRKERALPKLPDENDLPVRPSDINPEDLESGPANQHNADDVQEKEEMSVLTPLQQRRLQYHQAKFSKSHTFYKPHETSTHHAFPLRLLVAVVVLLDFHSIFQVALGTCTWSIDYEVRPQALTAVILCMSLSCNIAAGIIISVGDKQTRKKDVLERLFRQDLTKEAIKKIQKRHYNDEQDDMGVEVKDEARLGDVKGLKIKRASMDAGRSSQDAGESSKGRRSLDAAFTRGRKSREYNRRSMDVKRSKSLSRVDEGRKSEDRGKSKEGRKSHDGGSRSLKQYTRRSLDGRKSLDGGRRSGEARRSQDGVPKVETPPPLPQDAWERRREYESGWDSRGEHAWDEGRGSREGVSATPSQGERSVHASSQF